MEINCPYCGKRDHSEFTYLGDAKIKRPGDPDAAGHDDWMDYVYYRDNPKGEQTEYWHHQAGCRQWLRVVRHTVTHEISKVELAKGELVERELVEGGGS